MAGIAEYNQPASIIGTVDMTMPTPSDAHNPNGGDMGALLAGFNETNWDRWRGNTEGLILATAARTASTNSSLLKNYNARGVAIDLMVTGNPGNSETLQVRVRANNPTLADDANPIAVFAAVSAVNSIYRYFIYPGASDLLASTGVFCQSLPLPRTYYVQIVHSGSGSWTYGVEYAYIL